jgi:hypothetical protein
MPLIKYNNQSLSALTELPAAIPTGKLKLISSQTASNSASISFTSGLNSTYKVYKFVFVNIYSLSGGSGSNNNFQFNLSTDAGSNYNVTKTSTQFRTYHNEADTDTALAYHTDTDLAQSTAYQPLMDSMGAVSSRGVSGSMTLFNPASTTYVKHWISNLNNAHSGSYSYEFFGAGYGNTTSAVNAIRFQMSSGNFDGTIYLYSIDNS